MEIEDLRKNYRLGALARSELNKNPFEQFRRWFSDALSAKIEEPNAMSLATAAPSGKPSCRIVLLKHFDETGLHFFTNLKSRKAIELVANPFACAVFFWKELERQIIIEGKTQTLSPEESYAYFSKRPRQSQISAWASQQDTPLTSRQDLENEFQRLEALYQDKEIPLPAFWGGFSLVPERFEFWQGRKDRLHDRFAYSLIKNEWHIERLSP